MNNTLKITILTDKNSWMKPYINVLAADFKKLGHIVDVIFSKNDLKKGDVAFFLGCYEIIKKDKLSLNKYNLVVHESALPEGKGWSPMGWQILEGKKEIPITLFEANEFVDAGDIYLQDKIILDGTELFNEWRKKQAEKTSEMCLKFIKNYNKIKPLKQEGKETFYPKRTSKDDELDINKTIKEQFNLLRITDNENYPAHFTINGCKYYLKIEKESDL